MIRMGAMPKRSGVLSLSKGAGMSSLASEVQVINPRSRVGVTMPARRLGMPPRHGILPHFQIQRHELPGYHRKLENPLRPCACVLLVSRLAFELLLGPLQHGLSNRNGSLVLVECDQLIMAWITDRNGVPSEPSGFFDRLWNR